MDGSAVATRRRNGGGEKWRSRVLRVHATYFFASGFIPKFLCIHGDSKSKKAPLIDCARYHVSNYEIKSRYKKNKLCIHIDSIPTGTHYSQYHVSKYELKSRYKKKLYVYILIAYQRERTIHNIMYRIRTRKSIQKTYIKNAYYQYVYRLNIII